MFTELDQETLDIDYFFTNNMNIGFITSAGGKLPQSITNIDDVIYKYILNYFMNQKELSDYKLNPKLVEVFGNIDGVNFIDFINMAKRGLYTYYKHTVDDSSDTVYHLIALPTNPLILKNLPGEIINILEKTSCEIDISKESVIDVNSLR